MLWGRRNFAKVCFQNIGGPFFRWYRKHPLHTTRLATGLLGGACLVLELFDNKVESIKLKALLVMLARWALRCFMLEQNQAPGAALSLAGVGSLPIKPETWQLGEPFVTVFPQ